MFTRFSEGAEKLFSPSRFELKPKTKPNSLYTGGVQFHFCCSTRPSTDTEMRPKIRKRKVEDKEQEGKKKKKEEEYIWDDNNDVVNCN